MQWDLTGLHIEATYLEHSVAGTVESSRVAYGGRVMHTVVLDKPLLFVWSTDPRDRCIVEHQEVTRVSSS